MIDKDFLDFLNSHVSENKQEKFNKIIPERTRHLTVVLEDIYQAQNASAVVRTCDCFGVQDIHIIENENEYNVNPKVVMGSTKWLDLHHYNEKENNTVDALQHLKNQGYSIIGTTPHTNDCNIDELPVDQKTALVFGTEMTGLSEKAMGMCDGFVKIPMYGFTESFNISVSAALCVRSFIERMRKENASWQLSDEEQTTLKMDWVKKIVNKADELEKEFYQKK